MTLNIEEMRDHKIWIVDDDKMHHFITTKQLRKKAATATFDVFFNGEDALAKLESLIDNNEALPTCILLDLNMPIMDGWAFLDEIKLKYPHIASVCEIFIVTSSMLQQDRDKAKDYSFIKQYIVKPINSSELGEIILN
jgi:CheY-like chemotaxis protein